MDSLHINFDVEHAHFCLNCPTFLETLSLTKLRKLFKYMFQEPWRNETAIRQTEEAISVLCGETKEAWQAAILKYSNDYKDSSFDYTLTKEQRRKIEQDNKKLLNAVTAAKNKHIRITKVLNIFAEYQIKL